jgi:hypothetical protein
MPLELVGKDTLQELHGLRFVGAIQAGAHPRIVPALDDERRAVWRVLVGVHAPEAVLGVLEVESKRGKRLRRAEPDKPVRTDVDGCPHRPAAASGIREQPSHGTVHAVGGHDQVGISELVETVHFALELHLHACRACLLLQHVQQAMAAHAAEAVAGRSDRLAAIVHLDVVPVNELACDRAVGVGVGLGDASHRGVREHHAKAERVVGTIALEDENLVARVGLLHQHGEEESAGSAADTHDAHQDFTVESSASAMMSRWISVVPS